MVAGSASHVRRTDGTLGGSGEPPTTYSKRRVPQRTRPAPPSALRPPPPQLEPGSPLHHRYAVSDPWRQSPPSWPTLSRPSSSWPLPPAPDASPAPPPRLRSRLVVLQPADRRRSGRAAKQAAVVGATRAPRPAPRPARGHRVARRIPPLLARRFDTPSILAGTGRLALRLPASAHPVLPAAPFARGAGGRAA